MKPMTEEHLAILRRHMVEVIDMHFDLAEDEIGRDALSSGLRRALIRGAAPPVRAGPADGRLLSGHAAADRLRQDGLPALHRRADARAARHRAGQKVLEVGTGLGWQAAVMAELGADVFSVEIVEEFAQAARLRLASLDHGVEIRVGDGSRGWSDHAPFDRILVTAAAAEPPQALVDQLAPGGRMVIPLGGKEVQQLSVVERGAGGVTTRHVLPVRFTQLETA